MRHVSEAPSDPLVPPRRKPYILPLYARRLCRQNTERAQRRRSKASDASAKLFIRAYEKFGTGTMKENCSNGLGHAQRV